MSVLPKDESVDPTAEVAAEGQPTGAGHRPKVQALDSFLKLWKRKPAPEFPPQNWSKETSAANRAQPADKLEDAALNSAAAVPLPETPAVEVASSTPTSPTPAPITSAPDKDKGAQPDASTLAQRIRDLLRSYNPDDAPTPPPPKGQHPKPPPPPAAVDAALAKLLESAAVMNGSISKGKKSVWDALDRMRAPKHESGGSGKDKSGTEGDKGGDTDNDNDDDDGDSSLMVYAPLIPTTDSELELARHETVRYDAEGNVLSIIRDEPAEPAGEAATDEGKGESGGKNAGKPKKHGSWWPFPKKGKDTKKEEPQTVEKKVWVPSLTSISFQASWWGYRLYFPPPVMAILDNKSLEAAKRAAMITTALQWIITKIPTAIFPPPLRPAVMLVKKLLPYVGYIGAGIAWGWSSIKSFDKGNGVILTATWLLSVALVPGTWEEADVPKPAPGTAPTNPQVPGTPGEQPKGLQESLKVLNPPSTESTPAGPGAAEAHAPEAAL